MVHRLVNVWNQQEALIESGGLGRIFDIEGRKLIWVTAKIEATGIGIDVEAMFGYYDVLNNKVESLIDSGGKGNSRRTFP